ncbi:MAG: hypothetical protein U0T83_10285 [Bacteriovoracaceae bacterium]
MEVKSEEEKRILLLLKLDAHALFRRLTEWETQYISTFMVKRTRNHFREVFKTRYDLASFDVLKHCGQEVLITLDQYYTEIERLKWYFGHTEDLPGQIEDKLIRDFKKLKKILDKLDLYIDAEINNRPEALVETESKPLEPVAQPINLSEIPDFSTEETLFGTNEPVEEEEESHPKEPEPEEFPSEEKPDN